MEGSRSPISEPAEADPLSTISLALSMSAGTRDTAENKGKSEIQFTAESLDTIFSIAEELHLNGQEGASPAGSTCPSFSTSRTSRCSSPSPMSHYLASVCLALPSGSRRTP